MTILSLSVPDGSTAQPCSTTVSHTVDIFECSDSNGHGGGHRMANPTQNNQSLYLYPNPAVGEVHLRLQGDLMRCVEIESVLGGKVHEKCFDDLEEFYNLNVGTWSAGWYLVKVTGTNGRKYVQRFIKE
jgi:hypothetical protein